MARRNPLARLRNNIRTIERGMTFKARGEELKQAKRDLPASIEEARKKQKKIGALSLNHPRVDVKKQHERYIGSLKRGEEIRDGIRARNAKRVLEKV